MQATTMGEILTLTTRQILADLDFIINQDQIRAADSL
jgi:hypothetical protein